MTKPSHKSFIVHDGLKIEVNKFGSGDKTLILLAGWTHDFQYERRLIRQLSRKNTVYTISYPGYSGSDETPKAQSMRYLSEIIDTVAALLELKHFTLVGFSMGCQVVLNYLKRHIFQKAILISPITEPLDKSIPFYGKLIMHSNLLIKLTRRSRLLKFHLVQKAYWNIGNVTENVKRKIIFRETHVTLTGAFDTLIANLTSFIDPLKYRRRVRFIFGEKEVLQKTLDKNGVKYDVIKNSRHGQFFKKASDYSKLLTN